MAPRRRRVVSAAGGLGHSACITADGSIFTWGWGCYGQLGHGSLEDATVPVSPLELPAKCALRVDCGAGHTLAIVQRKSGSKKTHLYAWGFNAYGQLGLGDKADRAKPERVNELIGVSLSDVSCGDYHRLGFGFGLGCGFGFGFGLGLELGL